MKKKFLIAVGSLATPMLALAAGVNGDYLVGQSGLLNLVQKILNMVIPIAITIGVIMMIWAIFQLVTQKSEEERSKAKGLLIWIIIGLFLMVSIWGIIAKLGSILGIGQGGTTVIPCVVDSDGNALNGCD